MGYRRMNINDLKEIYRRLYSGQSLHAISEATGFDRKTIRGYRDAMEDAGLFAKTDPIIDDESTEVLFKLLPTNERDSPIKDAYNRHREELITFLNRKEDPLKPKTAYLVLKHKYDLPGSYESFKVFMRENRFNKTYAKPFPRIEYEPGQETQIDYCKCGLLNDPETGRRRTVNGYIAKLSSSRLPYVEFAFSQNQESFVESNVRMVEFFEGVTEYLTIDNLKAGVIQAHIYDPQLNRSYAEFAEHYGTFINPCIKGHAKGKPKVERQVQEVRELFRRLKELHPTFTLGELNVEARAWCLNEYGRRPHGTTGVPPIERFEREEKPTLIPLTQPRFEVPVWKTAKVHQDQFITFEKKRYSLPITYRGAKVICRRSGSLLKIFDSDYLFIRQYIITNQKIQITHGDFPDDLEAMMQGTYPKYLINRASEYGPGAQQLVESVLRPHAFQNARRALGFLDVLKEYEHLSLLQDVCNKAKKMQIKTPKQLKTMLEDEQDQHLLQFVVPRSASGEAMIRDIEDYF